MDGVRLVARIIGFVAWLVLIVGAVGLLILGSQLSRMLNTPGGMIAVLPVLIGVLLGALGPFFLWAVLTGLCELHDQGERVLHTVQNLEFTVGSDSDGAPSTGAAQKPSAASAAAHFGRNG
jgi:hypothetical protein